jgi:excisionase family DNA binding protein
MTENHIVVTTPNELYCLIEKAVNTAVKQISIPKKIDDYPNEFLTVQEASTMLNLAVPTIYSMVCKRQIPFNKIDGQKKIYFSKSELNEWLRNGRKPTKSEILENLKKTKRTN